VLPKEGCGQTEGLGPCRFEGKERNSQKETDWGGEKEELRGGAFKNVNALEETKEKANGMWGKREGEGEERGSSQ